MIRLSSIALLAVLGFAAFNLSAIAEDAAPAAPAAPAHKDGRECKEGRGAHMRERMHAMLFEGITLTDDQKAALEKMKEEHKEDRKGEHKGEHKKEMSREDRKAAMDKHLAAIRAILTDDQAKIFDANVKKMEAKRAEMEKKEHHGKGEGKGEGKSDNN